jgi:hypothetical protein
MYFYTKTIIEPKNENFMAFILTLSKIFKGYLDYIFEFPSNVAVFNFILRVIIDVIKFSYLIDWKNNWFFQKISSF